MAAIQGAISAAERSLRSVFVGNIPYEATEEQLKDVFCEVGPVVSFRLVYDRETGKPKGYGFCEYKDQETALSAMRNLNGYEFNGRALRVDNATSEKSKEELKNLQASLSSGPPTESLYGTEVESNEAPESISKAVASLPPEQMFELMKQMKMCIQNNPNEARNMLLQNPQLAYALLQAQVIMRIIDPQVALSILYRQNINLNSVLPQTNDEVQPSVSQTETSNQLLLTSQSNSFNAQQPIPVTGANPQYPPSSLPGIGGMQPQMSINSNRPPVPVLRTSLLGDRPPMGIRNEGPRSTPMPPFPENRPPETFDPRLARNLGDRDMRQNLGDRDMRQLPLGDRDMRQMIADQDLRTLPSVQNVSETHIPFDPRFRNIPSDRSGGGAPFDPRLGARAAAFDQRNAFETPRSIAPSQVRFDVPRPAHPLASGIPGIGMVARPLNPVRGAIPVTAVSTSAVPPPPQSAGPRMTTPTQSSTPDQEKAALIMQVLQLSDQQIALLPPEQRQSIMILKEQIARSAQS